MAPRRHGGYESTGRISQLMALTIPLGFTLSFSTGSETAPLEHPRSWAPCLVRLGPSFRRARALHGASSMPLIHQKWRKAQPRNSPAPDRRRPRGGGLPETGQRRSRWSHLKNRVLLQRPRPGAPPLVTRTNTMAASGAGRRRIHTFYIPCVVEDATGRIHAPIGTPASGTLATRSRLREERRKAPPLCDL